MQILQYDQEFLRKLDKEKNKTIYARITSLTFEETPTETIEGRITSGSINLDGASANRRTCSLSMVAQEFQYNDYYWGLDTKFKLEIGVLNLIDKCYPDIIWFNQGIYLITSFNPSRSVNNFTISINGKDKMCLLNGEVGGSLEAQVDFGIIEEEDKSGVWTKRKIPINEIIRNAIHKYAGEPMHNIIIEDLPEYGLELLEYRYDLPMYLYRKTTSQNYLGALINGDKVCRVGSKDSLNIKPLKNLTNSELDILVESFVGSSTPAEIYFDDDEIPYYVTKVEYGQVAGYRKTELTYAGELIGNVGESIVSILDKIKNMLGQFEYFYDIDGRFVFRKKRSYVNSPWSPIVKDESGEEMVAASLVESAATAYTFSGSELMTTFNNTPNLLSMRNDYAIWGQRTGISGSALPVHLRYAFDIKPTMYKSIVVDDEDPALDWYNKKYGTELIGQQSKVYRTSDGYDWREIIYQMACDYYKYSWLDDFAQRISTANPEYAAGRTGYEQYYTDLYSFWRELYNPYLQKEIESTTEQIEQCMGTQDYNPESGQEPQTIREIKGFIKHIEGLIPELKKAYAEATDKDSQQQGYLEYCNAQMALSAKKSQLVILEDKYDKLEAKLKDLNEEQENFYKDGERAYWCKDVFERPDQLNFWFDFLDTDGELSRFNVKTVGARPKSINDTNIKGIYFRDTPPVLFTDDLLNDNSLEGYKVIQIPKEYMDTMFSISAQGTSAKQKLDELVNQHGYCVENATINTVPIYYLEPNTRIYLYDEETLLDGDYIISKITLPLTFNGTMNITASKAANNIF